MCLAVLTAKGWYFCKFYPQLCYLSRGNSEPEPVLNKDPMCGIHSSLPHHRLDVPLLAMPLVFEYEKMITYFTVKKFILLLQKICAQICILLVELLLLDLSQKKGFISCDKCLCHFCISISLECVQIYLLKTGKKAGFFLFFNSSELVLQNMALTSTWHYFHYCLHHLSKCMVILVSHFS